MHLSLVVSIAATLALSAIGCSADSDSPDPAPPAVTYTKNVQPILMAKCGKCHAGQAVHNNMALNYSDAKLPAESLQFDECWSDVSTMTGPKTLGECAVLLTRAGKMPAFEGCDLPSPPDPSKCLTQAEKDTLAAWVAGGMPQ